MKKSKVTRSLLAACSIVALTAVMYGCVHDGGDEPATEPPVTEPEPEPTDTNLEDAQAAAKAAADDAKAASDAADEAADAAEAATMNLVGIQTNKDAAAAKMSATNARTHANTAMAEYMKAKAAAEAAAEATDARAAGKAERDAEAAKTAAEKAQMDAEAAADSENTDGAMMGLKIDGKTKSVGDTSITVDGVMRTGTDDEKTGLLEMTIMEKEYGASDPAAGRAYDATAATPALRAYIQAVAARDIDIGVQYDDPDSDMARLTLIHSYAGTTPVKVFGFDTAADTTVGTAADSARVSGTALGKITLDDGDADTTDTDNTSLKSEGMYYQAGADDASDGLTNTDVVAEDTESARVYSYATAGTDTILGTADDDTHYVVLQSTNRVTDSAGESETTYTYRSVDVDVAASAPDGPDAAADPDALMPVLAVLPVAKPYAHLHYGLWNSLKAEDEGDNSTLADLGIGFVTGQKADSRTGDDMPATGSASYVGNWVASVQANKANDGTISHQNGVSTVTADFDESGVNVALTGLATLTGAIEGDAFMGTRVRGVSDIGDMTASAAGSAFSGEFSGAFFGPKAAEAGGIFDYSSTDGGAFRGSFGGAKSDD